MTPAVDITSRVEAKVKEQLAAQRVGYLLGAGSSYLAGSGYPLASELWDLIRHRITDLGVRERIQRRMNEGATGLEHALDLLDDGGATDTPYRHVVTKAIAEEFVSRDPDLDAHGKFVKRLSQRGDPYVRVFSLNYDPLVERAAEEARVRLVDGFMGVEHSFFDPGVFVERIGQIRGTHRWKRFDETTKPVRLLKLHGSLGWYECPTRGVRRCAYSGLPPDDAKRLMVPPQRRKATDTMLPPYSALWSAFRGCLAHDSYPINRLACIGYGFSDEHVNAVIEAALVRTDFTLLIFTKNLPDDAWARFSTRANVVVVTEKRCSVNGSTGPGHADLWSFERLSKEV